MNELTIMGKTLRYLLIVIAMAGFLNVQAQGLAQQPQAQMQSTSVMQGAGSTLPQAAVTGTMVTGTTPGTYTPARISRPRRVSDDDSPGTEPGQEESTPLGDAMWPLILIACAYLILRVARKRTRALKELKS